MFAHGSVQEEAKLAQMQRAWQGRRGLGSSSLFDEVDETEQLLTLPGQTSRNALLNRGSCSSPPLLVHSCNESELELEIPDVFQEPKTPKRKTSVKESTTLDAAELGDLPARYTICNPQPHQLPVVGVYVDNRVIPGFKYRIRPLPSVGQNPLTHKCLFDDRALTLQSIGRGYARRFTFEADENKLNDNPNYFWSDNRPEGYAFELEVVSVGDKFTIFDADHEAQGFLEVLQLEGPQVEISNLVSKSGIEKRARVKFIGKVEFYETGVAKPIPLSGTAVCFKSKTSPKAYITKVINVVIKRHRYVLTPGVQSTLRRVTVKGQDIGDVPTKYTMTGLEPHEMPVVGTYVDPRIIPGFHYRVRPNDHKEHLFQGRSLKLLSIGMGYAKRLTFEPDSYVSPDNYLWSDNHPDGLGLEPRAIHKGMRFKISADGQEIGEASVFRVDLPQREEKMEKEWTKSGKYAIVKYIHIDVMCHVKMSFPDGGITDNEENLMRVCGLAVVRKEPNSLDAHVVRVENVGLDSQLNLLFVHTKTELAFYPM